MGITCNTGVQWIWLVTLFQPFLRNIPGPEISPAPLSLKGNTLRDTERLIPGKRLFFFSPLQLKFTLQPGDRSKSYILLL